MNVQELTQDLHQLQISWILLIVAILIVYSLGALWYSPVLFGDKWGEIVNPKFTKPSKEKVSFLPMIYQFIATALIGFVIFIGVRISIPLTIMLLVSAAGWQKASLFFKYPQFDTFVKVAFIEVGYFTIASLLFVVFGLM